MHQVGEPQFERAFHGWLSSHFVPTAIDVLTIKRKRAKNKG